MATIGASVRSTSWQSVRPLLVSLLLAGTALLLQFLPVPAHVQWAGLSLLPLAGWLGLAGLQSGRHRRNQAAIRSRLSRLPAEFTILDDVVVPAPWGRRQIDHVILSRYGVIIASAGMPRGAMCERVEAVRTLLFGARLMGPAFPIRPLILLPPGSNELPVHPGENAPVVRVEHLRLEHLAPAGYAVLNPVQLQQITQCLRDAQTA